MNAPDSVLPTGSERDLTPEEYQAAFTASVRADPAAHLLRVERLLEPYNVLTHGMRVVFAQARAALSGEREPSWHARWVELTTRVGTMVLSDSKLVRNFGTALLADMAQVEKDLPLAASPPEASEEPTWQKPRVVLPDKFRWDDDEFCPVPPVEPEVDVENHLPHSALCKQLREAQAMEPEGDER